MALAAMQLAGSYTRAGYMATKQAQWCDPYVMQRTAIAVLSPWQEGGTIL